MNPVGGARVRGGVRGERARDSHRTRLGRRQRRRRRRHDDRSDAVAAAGRGREEAGGRLGALEPEAPLRGDDLDAAAGDDGEARVVRRPADRLAQPIEPRVRLGAAHVDRRSPAAGQDEQLCEAPAGDPIARRPEGEPDGGREDRPDAGRHRASSAAVTVGAGSAPAAHRRPLEGRERSDDDDLGRAALERYPGAPCDDVRLQAAKDDRRLARRLSERRGHAPDLVTERGVEDLGRRRDVGAEETRVQAAESPHRGEALALVPGRHDRRRPVGAHAELPRRDPPATRAGDELDGDALEPGRTLLQHRTGLGARHAADLDAGDRDPVGQALLRARVADSERERRHHGADRGDRDLRPRDRARRTATAAAASTGSTGAGTQSCRIVAKPSAFLDPSPCAESVPRGARVVTPVFGV